MIRILGEQEMRTLFPVSYAYISIKLKICMIQLTNDKSIWVKMKPYTLNYTYSQKHVT